MDHESSSFWFRRPSSKLQKDPPRSLSNSNSSSLKRHPSAPVYPRSQNHRDHARSHSNAYGSSSSSLDQSRNHSVSAGSSPVTGGSDFPRLPHASRASYQKTGSEHSLSSAPSESRVLSNVLEEGEHDSDLTSGLRRPPARPSHHTSPDLRGLRQSASFTNISRMETALPQIDDVAPSAKRNSDDGNTSSKPRRKNTFSSIMNSVLGSPRSIKISAPENPVHVTHVGYDNQTGQFTVRHWHQQWNTDAAARVRRLTWHRAFPRTGSGYCRPAAFRKRNRSSIRRPWLTLCASMQRMPPVLRKTRSGISSNTPMSIMT